jgi:hypothetical protein
MKGDSLRDKLLEAIRGAYPNMYSMERLKALLTEINVERMAIEGKAFKESNMEKRLRELTWLDDNGYAPIRPMKNERGYLMGYIYQEPPRLEFKDVKIEFGGEQGQLAGIDTYRRF